MAENNNEVVLITGASKGIGYRTALYLKSKGYIVIATMRNDSGDDSKQLLEEAEKISNGLLEIKKLNVTVDSDVNIVIDSIIQKYKKIDILINNAGYGQAGSIEDVTIDEVKVQYDTNIYGVLRMIKAVLPHMRMLKKGRIINISSAVALTSFPMLGIYCSTKWAVDAISESLYHELKPYDIKISVIMPGQISTHFSGSSLKISPKENIESSPYYQLGNKVLENFEKNEKKLNTKAIIVSKVIYKAIKKKNPKFRYTAGKDSFQLRIARKLMPDKLLFFIIKKIIAD